jgi:hypothetical protein
MMMRAIFFLYLFWIFRFVNADNADCPDERGFEAKSGSMPLPSLREIRAIRLIRVK